MTDIHKARNIREFHGLDGESFRVGLKKVEEARDIELEDTVGEELVSRLDRARAETSVESEPQRGSSVVARPDSQAWPSVHTIGYGYP